MKHFSDTSTGPSASFRRDAWAGFQRSLDPIGARKPLPRFPLLDLPGDGANAQLSEPEESLTA
jgi:hypothetical protein